MSSIESPAPTLGTQPSPEPWKEEGIIGRLPSVDEVIEWTGNQAPVDNDSGTSTPARLNYLESIKAAIHTAKHGKEDDTSLLGRTGVLKNGDFVSDPVDDETIFGNEDLRLKKFKRLSYGTFKEKIIRINKSVRTRGDDNAPGVDGITLHQRLTTHYGRIPHYYPDSDDIDELLQYSLQKAQAADTMQDAALIVGLGFVETHPFSDGNGRTSRALYAELSGGLNPETLEYNTATAGTASSREYGGGSSMIKLGGIIKNDGRLNEVRSELINEYAGFEIFNDQIGDIDFSKEPNSGTFYAPPVSAKDVLDARDYQWLATGYDNLRGISIERDGYAVNAGADKSFKFGLGYVASQMPGVLSKYLGTELDPNMLSVNALMHSGDQAVLAKLAEGVRLYYKLGVIAEVNMIADGSRMKMKHEYGSGTISVRDRIVDLSRNFVTSKLPNNY